MNKLLKLQLSRIALVSGISFIAINGSLSAIASWMEVSKAPDNAPIYIDPERIVRKGDIVEFWRRNLFTNPQPDGAFGVDNYHSINCKKGLFRWRRSIRFDPNGRIVSENDIGKEDKLLEMQIQPGSIMEDFYKSVCPPLQEQVKN
ncbi:MULTISPECIES: surface-adhesin E family protein [Cyanophyceae]|uniref:surface-adhesin E family protein n=1 Tax=Cyanophyceae TaxID=3028117 RepID=UPI001682D52F|nr:surface-adhesin E family protein [Trichocoleus sp. FACHB-69]MBD1934587.1 hypothetical protein [Trichocoleus sp. FACHB-69]